ncbi:ORF6N domain-containing protein [Pseudomonas sp. OIL-1]|uniref:ORF6N domain-containing protein n=1 Tax=Pseudomonas sp. OIL-1 TaxID=2706126 RepID=UPI0013A76977|nr:ORF6N domain-containing protein [Pseudomonas sp. OIL-1]QIB51746.1 ORF6N domain-containing protein [Pseudomonas sp. OIL-1]
MARINPIEYAGQATLSFKQLDELNGVEKGTAFRAFKRRREQLVEQIDFFYLNAAEHAAFIESLKASGQIYRSTNHLVLFSRNGYQRLLGLG